MKIYWSTQVDKKIYLSTSGDVRHFFHYLSGYNDTAKN